MKTYAVTFREKWARKPIYHELELPVASLKGLMRQVREICAYNKWVHIGTHDEDDIQLAV